eukprot:maker-scaffold_23-snap-gene-1.2-mRNA-1 protein AED:0.02 eAED:0.02 QI:52/1/1/1/1/1/4/81/735
MESSMFTSFLIVATSIAGLFFSFNQWQKIKRIPIRTLASPSSAEESPLTSTQGSSEDTTALLLEIHDAISRGASSFLASEYKICFVFLLSFATLIFFLISSSTRVSQGLYSAIAFLVGGFTSLLAGYIGMKVAVFTNVRTTSEAQSLTHKNAFLSAFRGGAAIGFSLCSIGILSLFILINVYFGLFPNQEILFETIASFGCGASTIAMFGRIGGGIYTKAADVGADLVGKVEQGIPEDDPRNPATIADNVGDNVGDVAGNGSDLYGSFAESTCAAFVLTSLSPELSSSWKSAMFPLIISTIGLLCCIVTTYFATDIRPVQRESDVEKVLKYQLILSTVFITPTLFIFSWICLPAEFTINGVTSTWTDAFGSAVSGLWSGLLIGLITEYFTSHSYTPVREVATSSKTGAATLIIYGLALGYKSTIIPVGALGVTIFFSFRFCGMYGVALAALGMLSSLSIGLSIDCYGPISDNAGGIAEMTGLGKGVRDITDALDAAGNTTAAIGKGFAIGSAALVSLALFGAFVSRITPTEDMLLVNVLDPLIFAFLLFGSMLPYWFSAMTMKAVGIAAMDMVIEVREQFAQIPGLMEGTAKPNYERCVAIATQASLKQMIAPSLLVILSPLLTGYIFGVHALTGLLTGSMCSAVQLAISSSNSGGAWDNAKKYIEAGNLGGKGSECHKAAVVGDTVGDPMKDTSGPALNIVMKLMAILSLVFADFFLSHSLARGKDWAGYPQAI